MLKLLLLSSLTFAVITPNQEISNTESLEAVSASYSTVTQSCIHNNSFIATHKQMSLNGNLYGAGTEIFFDENGEAFVFTKTGEPQAINLKVKDFKCEDVTIIPYNPETGELAEYNIPLDFKMAGKSKKVKTRGGGVTHCYRAVKARVNGKSFGGKKVYLSGVAAYMAYPQLKKAGLKKHSYEKAPSGSICVFGAGGKKTPSGGQKYGHIGIKGTGGITNPQSGFALGRPFLGCFK